MDRLAVDPHNPASSVLASAVETLQRDGIVAFPTETFYGLAVDATSAIALARLNRLKQRPDTPILILVGSVEAARRMADALPGRFEAVAERFWPGPLTLVLPARADLPQAITAGRKTVGVRLPGSRLARRLASQSGGAISGVSANLHGGEPCSDAAAVAAQLAGRVDLLLDGGSAPGGLPSTLLDLSVEPPRILRRGVVTREALLAVCPDVSG